jgi:hypothetical protein
MRSSAAAVVVVLVLAGGARSDDERAAKVTAQKAAALAAWNAVEAGERCTTETKHLLVYAPSSVAKRIGAVGKVLEKYHDLAAAALGVKPEDDYPGKITVYLLPQEEHLTAFARRVEKRRPRAGEAGSFSAGDALLHAAAAPAAGKNAPPVEALAGEQLAALLLMRKAGERTSVPDWLVQGFGRATSYRALPAREKFVAEDRKRAKALAARHTAGDVWDGALDAEEAGCLQGSLCEMLAYGAGRVRFVRFVEAFKPAENMLTKTTAQAMEAAGISPEKVGKLWKKSVGSR